MIEPDTIEERHYQRIIALSCVKRSTLIVIPTGLGKTVIALRVIAETLRTKKGNILFMAPTKPLVEQHARLLGKHLIAELPVVFTGEVSPGKRKEMWKNSQIIVATPQVISNDLVSGQIDLNGVSLIIFDEAHRAVGDYAYVFIGERFRKLKGSHVIGMTASPGNQADKILEVCENLNIEGVEIRHDYDPDVVKYVHDVYIKWIELELPEEMKKVVEHLKKGLDEQVAKLRKYGYVPRKKLVTTTDLLSAQRQIQGALRTGSKSSAAYSAATTAAIAMTLNQALERAETQGVAALKAYFERLRTKAVARHATKASTQTIALPKVQMAMKALKKLEAAKVETPKLEKVKKIVVAQLNSKPDSRIIVFTHYRDTCELVTDELGRIEIVRPARFVGQASKGKDKGMRQKQQVEMIDRFKDGEFNVLVATSIAEEGLDIPTTDLIVMYEPVPSEIRTIQRRGRTGRRRTGKVVILITKGTRDEAYYWSSKHKESRMHKELEKLRKELQKEIKVGGPTVPAFKTAAEKSPMKKMKTAVGKPIQTKSQRRLGDFEKKPDEKLKIIADTREFNSPVVRNLAKRDVIIESVQLDIGDYLISERVGVERKEVDDFLASLMDGRLFQQARTLKRAYQSPLMIIEGEDLFSRRRISPDAIYGALASITVDFGIPIMSTKDDKETAELLLAITKREAAEGRTPGIRGEKGTMLLQERQQFILEGLPNVSGIIAQRLLAHFGSVSAVLEASDKDLQKVKGVGKVIAKGIRETLDAPYYSKEKE